MPYKRLGKQRKNGPAKRGMGQAAWKRYNRAVKKMENTGKVNKRDMADIRQWLKVTQDRVKVTKHAASAKAVEGVQENLTKAINLYSRTKVVNTLKKNNKDISIESLSARMFEVVSKISEGEEVEGYTLLPTARAYTNHTVEAIYDLPDGTTLCKYKD